MVAAAVAVPPRSIRPVVQDPQVHHSVVDQAAAAEAPAAPVAQDFLLVLEAEPPPAPVAEELEIQLAHQLLRLQELVKE